MSDNKLEALKLYADWSKWLAAIATGAIGALVAYLLTNRSTTTTGTVVWATVSILALLLSLWGGCQFLFSMPNVVVNLSSSEQIDVSRMKDDAFKFTLGQYNRVQYVALYIAAVTLGAFLYFSGALGAATKVSTTTEKPVPEVEPIHLRVALFPYIPDVNKDKFVKLSAELKRRFEEASKHKVVLDLTMDGKLDAYDPEQVKSWLATDAKTAIRKFDVVEIDTVLLDQVVNVIAPWSVDSTDWHPAAKQSVSIESRTLGVPHWLCSHFLFSRDASVAKTTTIRELTEELSKAKTTPHMAARFTGSFNVPSLYLDAWVDSDPNADTSQGLPAENDVKPVPTDNLKQLISQCAVGDTIPCLVDSKYDASTTAIRFGAEESSAYIGYSEALNLILASRKDSVEILFEVAPLGTHTRPLVFTDALIRSAECSGVCEKAANEFAAFLDSPATMEYILLSQDAGSAAIPRYLLPATKSAAAIASLKADKYYELLIDAVDGARPYPNHDFYQKRKALADVLSKAWRGE